MESIWAMFTNNGMYSDIETIIMLILSVIGAFLIMRYFAKEADRKQRSEMLKEMSYEGYLKITGGKNGQNI